MIALGLALVLIAAVAGVFVVVASATTSTAIELTAFNITFLATPMALFFAGAVSIALLGLGFVLVGRGTRRTARTRRELKQLRKETAGSGTRAVEPEMAGSDNSADSPGSNSDQDPGKGTGRDAAAGVSGDSTSGTSPDRVSDSRGGNTAKGPVGQGTAETASEKGTEQPVERHQDS